MLLFYITVYVFQGIYSVSCHVTASKQFSGQLTFERYTNIAFNAPTVLNKLNKQIDK